MVLQTANIDSWSCFFLKYKLPAILINAPLDNGQKVLNEI